MNRWNNITHTHLSWDSKTSVNAPRRTILKVNSQKRKSMCFARLADVPCIQCACLMYKKYESCSVVDDDDMLVELHFSKEKIDKIE